MDGFCEFFLIKVKIGLKQTVKRKLFTTFVA